MASSTRCCISGNTLDILLLDPSNLQEGAGQIAIATEEYSKNERLCTLPSSCNRYFEGIASDDSLIAVACGGHDRESMSCVVISSVIEKTPQMILVGLGGAVEDLGTLSLGSSYSAIPRIIVSGMKDPDFYGESYERAYCVFDARNGDVVMKIEEERRDYFLQRLVCVPEWESAGGGLLASYWTGSVSEFDTCRGVKVGEFRDPAGFIEDCRKGRGLGALVFRGMICAAGDDVMARLWDRRTRQLVNSFELPSHAGSLYCPAELDLILIGGMQEIQAFDPRRTDIVFDTIHWPLQECNDQVIEIDRIGAGLFAKGSWFHFGLFCLNPLKFLDCRPVNGCRGLCVAGANECGVEFEPLMLAVSERLLFFGEMIRHSGRALLVVRFGESCVTLAKVLSVVVYNDQFSRSRNEETSGRS